MPRSHKSTQLIPLCVPDTGKLAWTAGLRFRLFHRVSIAQCWITTFHITHHGARDWSGYLAQLFHTGGIYSPGYFPWLRARGLILVAWLFHIRGIYFTGYYTAATFTGYFPWLIKSYMTHFSGCSNYRSDMAIPYLRDIFSMLILLLLVQVIFLGL